MQSISYQNPIKSNRLAWFVYYREVPKLCVLHKCDNRACVRKDHLFLGTRGDNNSDRAAKGRSYNVRDSLGRFVPKVPRSQRAG